MQTLHVPFLPTPFFLGASSDPEFLTRNHEGHQRGHGVGGGIDHETTSHQEFGLQKLIASVDSFFF